MDQEQWLEVVRSARQRSGVVTPGSVREAALDTGLAAELLAERAATLSRMGARLDALVARLEQIRVVVPADRDALVAEDQVARRELADAQWEMQVVKEAMGLRRVRPEIDRTWPMPPPIRR